MYAEDDDPLDELPAGRALTVVGEPPRETPNRAGTQPEAMLAEAERLLEAEELSELVRLLQEVDRLLPSWIETVSGHLQERPRIEGLLRQVDRLLGLCQERRERILQELRETRSRRIFERTGESGESRGVWVAERA